MKIRVAAFAGLIVWLGGGSPPVLAQEEGLIEEVVVTGTYIPAHHSRFSISAIRSQQG